MSVRRIRRGLALAPADRRMAIEALVMLAVGRIALVILPFRVAMPWLGLRLKGTPAEPSASQDTVPEMREIAHVGTAIRRAASIAPFRAVCLQQAVAAALMLRRRGEQVEVHLGVARESDGSLIAHAWSECRGLSVTGADEMPNYHPVSVFVT